MIYTCCARNTKTLSAAHPPISIHPLLQPVPPTPSKPNGSPAPSIVSTSLRPNGAPLIHLSSGTAHSYEADLGCWVTVGESFWLGGSSAWKTRVRSSSNAGTSGVGNGIVNSIEEKILEQTPDSERLLPPADRPPWHATALTFDHLGTRMHAARVLGSPQEYRQALLLYAKLLADEGFRQRAEELLKDLYGPIYWSVAYSFPNVQHTDLSYRRPGKTEINWCPTVVGLTKRDLAKDVLTIFGKYFYNTQILY